MRGPLKEQIQNAINRALKENFASNNQAAYINVGGRRRNRKKKKAKKNTGVVGSAWSTLNFQVNEPPARCLVEIPPKAKGSSPQVTKAKKVCKETCKELKARLSPPRSCSKDALEADDKPLIGNEAAEDENENEAQQADQENVDPSNMPLSSLFKTTKARKSKKDKKGKGKDAADTNAAGDVTGQKEAQAEEQTRKTASPLASGVIATSASDDVKKTEQAGKEEMVTKEQTSTAASPPPPTCDVIITPTSSDDVKMTQEQVGIGMEEKVEGAQEEERKGDNTTDDQAQQQAANSTDTKTDMTADGGQDTAAVLYTTDSRDVSLTLGEGPQLTQRPPEEGEAVVVEDQPGAAVKAPDGSLPPETAPTGREKQSLLHDHNPEGMVCCTIL